MFDYKLVFDNEQQANDVIEQVTGDLHPKDYVLYIIGAHIKREWPNGEDQEPVITLASDKWLVDLRLREANDLLNPYNVVVKTPIHNFS